MRWDIFSLSVVVLVLGLASTTVLFEWLNDTVHVLMKTNYSEMCKKWPSMCGERIDDNDLSLASDEGSFSLIPEQSNPKVFLESDISSFNGEEKGGKIYLAFLGQVYDVSSGKDYYGPSGAYHQFSGRDATRAYMSGDFTEEGLHSDVSDLQDKELVELQGWLELYRDKYIFIGVVQGLYFAEDGSPTPLLRRLEALFRHELSKKNTEVEAFPACDMQWTLEEGSTWWCSTNSGGVEREWVGLPRLRHAPGAAQARCVCARHELLGDPHLRPVPGCGEQDVRCYLGQT